MTSPDGRVLRRGEATLFAAAADGRLTPIVTLRAPALLAHDTPPADRRWVERLSLDAEVTTTDDRDEYTVASANTVDQLGDLVRPAATPPGERVVRLGARPTFVSAGRTAVVDTVSWVRAVEGSIRLAGVDLPAAGAPIPTRLALRSDGLTAASATPLISIDAEAIAAGVSWLATTASEIVLADAAADDLALARRIEAAPFRAEAVAGRAVRLLAAELGTAPEPPPPVEDPLVACAAMVAATSGLTVRSPGGDVGRNEGTAAVRAVASVSGLYVRRVRLAGRWWTDATDGVLGFRPDGTPVAFLPEQDAYVAVTADGAREPVDETSAVEFLDAGFTFAAPPAGDDTTVGSLLRTAARVHRRDLRAAVGWAAILGVLALAAPLASGVVFGEIIPTSDRTRLGWLVVCLVAVAIAGVPLQIAFVAAAARFEAATSFDVQRVVWARLMRSPVAFTNHLGPGELTRRLGGLEGARDPLDRGVLRSVPTIVGALAAAVVLFTYDTRLATTALVFGVVVAASAVLLARTMARRQRRLEIATGAVNGFTLQVLSAIAKLRVAAAESRAFLAWAERFRGATGQDLMRAGARAGLLGTMTPTLGTLVLFTAVAVVGPEEIPIGRFLAFQVSFGIFLAGVSAVAGGTGAVIQQRPMLDDGVELARAPSETGGHRSDPGALGGGLSLAGVTFRYVPTQRAVLDELHLRIEPGEMVAIAGHSGCGKSTIIRLLLGFEHPERGSVLFDDRDLQSLDVEAVRRQIGVVLQDTQLVPGTIGDNLAGVASLTREEKWELAELVALADDIRAMPMQLETPVMLNGAAFSGGQRQRLAIARALAPRPRVLLLDEATSALDNVTQRVITENLAQLGMTRIVVAHRLSTMADADRIVVLDRGKVAEQGTFATLMEARGAFFALAERQLV